MPKIVIMKGLPGSGKSTYALRELVTQGYKRINKDDLRRMIDGGRWSGKNEKMILLARDQLIGMFMRERSNIVIDDTNLHPSHVQRIREIVDHWNQNSALGREDQYELIVDEQFLEVPVEECIRQDLQRLHSVGEKVIRDMHKKFLTAPPPDPEVYAAPRPHLPEIVLCDLDGTLCDLNGRDPYASHQCENDLLVKAVHDLLRAEIGGWGTQVIFMSGRKEYSRPETMAWLEANLHSDVWVNMVGLFMRSDTDNRKDAIVKKELFFEHVYNRYKVKYVLDDRNQVVDMWRNELGLTVLQVADGDF